VAYEIGKELHQIKWQHIKTKSQNTPQKNSKYMWETNRKDLIAINFEM